MIKIEDIDINNREAIAYLRNMLVQFLTKWREFQIDKDRKAKARIDRLNADMTKIQTPEEKAKKQTVFNNIVFFLGSLISPAVTPSEYFGKASTNQQDVEDYNNLMEMSSSLRRLSKQSCESALEIIVAIDKTLAGVTNDEALLQFFVELSNAYEMCPNKSFLPIVDTMLKCGYFNQEAYSKVRSATDGTIDLYNEIIYIIDDCKTKMGIETMQKGR